MTSRKKRSVPQPPRDLPRVLFSWLGFADCGCAVLDLKEKGRLSEDEANRLFPPERQKDLPDKYRSDGKLKLLLDQHRFAEVHILSDLDADLTRTFRDWLAEQGHQITVHSVSLSDAYNYELVYRAVTEVLREFLEDPSNGAKSLAFYLNPGTTAMGAVWFLLAHSQDFRAELYQLAGRGSTPQLADIPFEIGGVDFLPDIRDRRQKALAGLAAAAGQEIPALEGKSEAIQQANRLVMQYASTPFDVLIHGASGTGKDVVATRLNDLSPRGQAGKPFVAVNCAAFPPNLLESELFGHVKGAFTGADKPNKGKFVDADGGTLFLDELGECSLDMQAKLLRVLQPSDPAHPTKRNITPVGAASTQAKTVDVRVFAATNRDLREMVEAGSFRADLYHRLAALVIRMPSLKERPDDIRLYALTLLEKANAAMKQENDQAVPKQLTESALSALTNIDWTGNIRQLNAVIVRAVVVTVGDLIDARDIFDALTQDPLFAPVATSAFGRPLDGTFSLRSILDQEGERYESDLCRHYVSRALTQAGGGRKKAAALLGLDPTHFSYYATKAGLRGNDAQEAEARQ
jgi:DNA-binding NtrC family response regulator